MAIGPFNFELFTKAEAVSTAWPAAVKQVSLYENLIVTYQLLGKSVPVTQDWSASGDVIYGAVPGIQGSHAACPVGCSTCDRGRCKDYLAYGYPNLACSQCRCAIGEASLLALVIHLNDVHGWARAASEAEPGKPNIADWLEEYALLNNIDLTFKMPEGNEA
jgi:hypothetical protein